jgi:hypothetical protein
MWWQHSGRNDQACTWEPVLQQNPDRGLKPIKKKKFFQGYITVIVTVPELSFW